MLFFAAKYCCRFFMTLSPDLLKFLAVACDTYTPVLLVLAFASIAMQWRKGNKFHGFVLVYFVVIVYGWMFVDKHFQLWSSMGLDYSTHTAAALSLVVFNSFYKTIAHKLLLAASLIAYGCLMFILQYHSWSDMFSTACAIGVFLFAGIFFLKKINAR